MAQFEEVLGGVRLALTWACPAEIQALLEGLVEERIISEAYSKSLSLHRLIKGIEAGSVHSKPAWEAGSDQINSRGPATHQGHLGQVWKCGSPKSRESAITCDDQYSFRFNDEITELLRDAESVQKMISDNERIGEGNSDDEKEWLETVEEVARKIAVPLWQHWDRGQRMLLPLVSCMMTGCAISESTTLDCEAQCPSLNMEEETELTIACRTLDLYSDNFHFREAEDTDTSFTLESEGATDSLKGLCLSAFNSAATTGLNMDHVGNVSPVEACTATDTSNADTCLEGHLSVCCLADGTTDTTDDLMCLAGDTDAGFDEDDSFYSKTDHSIAAGVLENLENVFRTAYGTARCSIDSTTDFHEKKEEERVDPHWGAKMHEVDQDQFITLELGDLPDDLSEFMKDDYLPLIDTDVLFGDVWLNGEDSNNFSDVALPTELPCTGSHQQRQKNKVTGKTNSGRKRKRATTILKSTRAQRRTDENTPSKPKKRRPADKLQGTDEQHEPAVTQSTDTGLEQNPAEAAGLTTTPPRILHLHPPIQFIFPDSGYVQTLRLSPPVIGLPLLLPLLVPAASTPCKRQVQPPSPVDGAVAPVQMSSSPPGSMSDTASKAMPPLCNSPGSPSNEMSPCKEPPLPQSPTVLDIPQVVQDYIQEVKAHMSQTCQDMEEGLTLSSHYVDMQVSRREILRSGKSANKCLDKELIIMGDTDRQKSLLRQSQIFEGSNGDKSKHCILLLGNAGMGKTTLIRKLCLDWSIDCIPQFDFVFLLDGKALTLTKPTFSLQTLLLNLSSFAPSCMDPEAVYAQILAAPKRVLIVFDGFDQLRDYESLLQTQEKDLIASLQKDSKAQTYTVRQLYSAILQRVLLPGCTLLLATRPRGTASQLLRRADSFLEVCGFSPTDVETYLSQYFTDPALRASALDWLKNCTYLHLLCWNPGLCRLVCLVLEQSKSLEDLPRTLTGLCHQVLRLKMDKDNRSKHSQAEDPTQISLQAEDPTQISLQAEDPTQISLQAEDPTQISLQAEEETQTQISSNMQTKRCHKNTQKRSRAQVRTRSRTQRTRRAKEKEEEENEVDGEEMNSGGREADRTEERELLSQLSSLAWEGVKANSSILPTGRTLSDKLKAFGLRMRLFLSHPLRTRLVVLSGEGKEGGTQDKDEVRGGEKGDRKGNRGGTEINNVDANDDHIVLWANPFLQSYLAGVHLSLSRTLSDRNFLQTLPFQSGLKGRRRPQREELELTQRFTVGLLFHKRTELQRLHSNTETSFRNMVVNKQALVTKHLEGLSHGDLSPAQVLEACHYVYEASFTHSDGSGGTGSARLVTHLAANLPEVLTFHGVPLNPPDVFTLQNVLERGGTEGRSFCLDLEDSGIQVSGLRALVGLKSINTYRACIADVITLWEQLEQSGEEGLLRGAVSKLNIHPLKATQVCHVEHLAKLVNIHMHKRLTDSCSQSDSILAEGVPAVKELHKLEFELGPEKGPLGLPKLWELLPGLQNLQHLDLENSKIGDKGAEKLADALASLCSLEILNLSQNCIGDNGVKKLASTLSDLPKLHCLSLYSNVISDEGAESLAAVLPHMASLTELDVKYNKLTDVGAQSLGASLRKCQKIKTLRMWNQCIPYGVFERLQQQDSRILWH